MGKGTCIILAQPLLSVGAWSALGILLQLFAKLSEVLVAEAKAAGCMQVGDSEAGLCAALRMLACNVTKRNLIRNVDACELSSGMQ